jgi:hypothetical protein
MELLMTRTPASAPRASAAREDRPPSPTRDEPAGVTRPKA